MSEPKTVDPMTAALLRERDGYLRAGKIDRVAAVDEQLRARGYDVPADESREPAPDPVDQVPHTATRKPRTTRAPRNGQ